MQRNSRSGITIHSVRYGFATNSSSTHSLVFFNPNHRMPQDDSPGCWFGWEMFTLSSHKSKLNYLATAIFENLSLFMCKEYAQLLVPQLDPRLADVEIASDAYIDHQSLWTLPRERETIGYRDHTMLHQEFLRDLCDFILQPNLVIFGGNDNDSSGFAHGGFQLPITEVGGSYGLFARKDPRSGTWTLFSPEDGTKIRFSFDELKQENIP